MRELVHDWGGSSPELIEEMIVTAFKIARDRMGIADLKLINRSIKELRFAKVFVPFQGLRKVALFGSARTLPSAPEFKVAEDFAREMVSHNYMVITGGGDRIMGAAQRGAGRKHSFGLNIRVPFEHSRYSPSCKPVKQFAPTILNPNRRSFGRFRQLIDAVNSSSVR
jgi:Predicted Rossmann fold nucleotide-binding protein